MSERRHAYADMIDIPKPCRWYRAPECPGGRYLVPGCWNRAVYGDEAECHCEFARPICKTCGQEIRNG